MFSHSQVAQINRGSRVSPNSIVDDNSVLSPNPLAAQVHPCREFGQASNLHRQPGWQAPAHFFDDTGSRVSPSSTVDNSVLSPNQSAAQVHPFREFGQASNLHRQPGWQAPANFFDDIDTDDSISVYSSVSRSNRNFVPVQCRWQPPGYLLDVGQDESVASSTSSITWSEIRASMRRAEVERFRSQAPNFDDPNTSESSDDEPSGGRINVCAMRDRRERSQMPCFGNALPEPEEENDMVPLENDSPKTTVSNPNTTIHDEISLSHGEYNAKNVFIDFSKISDKPKCGAEPMIDVEKFEQTLLLADKEELKPSLSEREWNPSPPTTAVVWEQMDCRERRYPWIADVMEMYETPPENRDILKECETSGRFLVVEQFHDENYDYVKCWTMNLEFPMRMMIAPHWCFPDQRPKVGCFYTCNFHMVLHKIGPYKRRKILRLKAGTAIFEDKRRQSRFLGKVVRWVQSENCWAKILKMHVRVLYTAAGEDMQTYNFGRIIFDKSQALVYPEGAYSIEGTGWIEPVPGVFGTNADHRTSEVKLFYLTGRFSETVIEWDNPYPIRTPTVEEEHRGFKESRQIRDSTRYEWQPRHALASYHQKSKKSADARPRIVPSKSKHTKSQRILLSIEILRKIRARKSVFAQLNPDNVFRLECVVGDREVTSKSKRLCELTTKLCSLIEHKGAYDWIMAREPETIKDMFSIIKMNVNYLPNRMNSVAEWLRPIMFPVEEDSDYEKWD